MPRLRCRCPSGFPPPERRRWRLPPSTADHRLERLGGDCGGCRPAMHPAAFATCATTPRVVGAGGALPQFLTADPLVAHAFVLQPLAGPEMVGGELEHPVQMGGLLSRQTVLGAPVGQGELPVHCVRCLDAALLVRFPQMLLILRLDARRSPIATGCPRGLPLFANGRTDDPVRLAARGRATAAAAGPFPPVRSSTPPGPVPHWFAALRLRFRPRGRDQQPPEEDHDPTDRPHRDTTREEKFRDAM